MGKELLVPYCVTHHSVRLNCWLYKDLSILLGLLGNEGSLSFQFILDCQAVNERSFFATHIKLSLKSLPSKLWLKSLKSLLSKVFFLSERRKRWDSKPVIEILGGILEVEVQEYLSFTVVLAELILTHSEMLNKNRKEEVREFPKTYFMTQELYSFVCLLQFMHLWGKISKKK